MDGLTVVWTIDRWLYFPMFPWWDRRSHF